MPLGRDHPHRAGVLAGVVLLVVGVVVAGLGYRATPGPADVVRAYFAALARADAPAALSYGDVPAGPKRLLTTPVLRTQSRLAALQDLVVTGVTRQGRRAIIAVRYALAFPDARVPVQVDVGLHEAANDWRLDRVAVPTTLQLDRGGRRASILGTPVPAGPVLLFPGAVPITFDSPYLALDPQTAGVAFGAGPVTAVSVLASNAGQVAMVRAVHAALTLCLTAVLGTDGCPLPTERYLPGSLRGSLSGPLSQTSVTVVPNDADGELALSALAPLRASFRRLDFRNREVAGLGALALTVHALAFAVAPLRIRWTS